MYMYKATFANLITYLYDHDYDYDYDYDYDLPYRASDGWIWYY